MADNWEPDKPNFTFDSIASSPSSINSFIFDTLVDFDFNSGEFVPNLAEQWVVTKDSKQWIFTLREGITFHDGSIFNASAVKFTFDRFIDPAHPAYVPDPFIELHELPLESVEILSEYSIAFNFFEPYVAFISTHASYIDIISPNSFEGPIITSPIGTGPYIYNSASKNDTYCNLTRNPHYHRGLPPFETIDYLIHHSYEDFETAVTQHEGDFVLNDRSDPEDSYWQVQTSDFIDSFELVWFNHTIPELADVRVRQALNYAIDKDFYVQNSLVLLDGVPLSSFFPQSIIFHDSTVPGFPYNVAKANKLLDEAGYPRTADGYRFDLELTVPNYREGNALLLASFLDAIGIRCEVLSFDFNTYLDNKFYTGNYALLSGGWGGFLFMDPASFTYAFLHTSGRENTGGYSSPEMDKYIMLGQQTPVQQEREYYYQKVQQLVQEEVPYLLLRELNRKYLLTSQVAPFITRNKNGRIGLNYASWETNKFHYKDVDITARPIYFPFADVIIESPHQQPLNVNLTTSHHLSSFLPTSDDTAKFFQLQVADNETGYSFRCYYDFDEIPDLSTAERLELFQWDENENQWESLKTLASNTSLRYVEVNLKGGQVLLKLTVMITYRYFPLVFLIIGGTVSFATIAVVINWSTLRAFKEKYEL
ncbi:MAG: ABC transporter substrate-binding protein [Candidatus Odinarchaeota archaeon]